MSVIYYFSTLNFSLILFIFVDFRLYYCHLNFIADLKKMKIYSNKRDKAARENIGFWINRGRRNIYIFWLENWHEKRVPLGFEAGHLTST